MKQPRRFDDNRLYTDDIGPIPPITHEQYVAALRVIARHNAGDVIEALGLEDK
jgi:hypothetical protein